MIVTVCYSDCCFFVWAYFGLFPVEFRQDRICAPKWQWRHCSVVHMGEWWAGATMRVRGKWSVDANVHPRRQFVVLWPSPHHWVWHRESLHDWGHHDDVPEGAFGPSILAPAKIQRYRMVRSNVKDLKWKKNLWGILRNTRSFFDALCFRCFQVSSASDGSSTFFGLLFILILSFLFLLFYISL